MPKFQPVQARAAGFYDADAASLDSGLACKDPSLTVQSQAKEADINTIVERFHLTGEIPLASRVPFPTDVDFDEILDFKTANDRLLQARDSFLSLPASVRSQFQNDPLAFADFATVPDNLPKLREWGLAPAAPPAPEPAPAPPPSA